MAEKKRDDTYLGVCRAAYTHTLVQNGDGKKKGKS